MTPVPIKSTLTTHGYQWEWFDDPYDTRATLLIITPPNGRGQSSPMVLTLDDLKDITGFLTSHVGAMFAESLKDT